MWKYCVTIWYAWMRDLRTGRYNKHYEYCEQRYFHTKAEARKGYTKAVREIKKMLNERRMSCHEHVKVYEHKQNMLNIGLDNRFSWSSQDQVIITMEEVKIK